MNYLNALYRKNNFGQPCFWYGCVVGVNAIRIKYGILGKTIIEEYIHAIKPNDVLQSRINAKRKTGYKFLSEIKDNNTLPVEGELINYLTTYLPDIRTTADGSVLPMLAKVYDNTNNKLFKNETSYFGQWKINGLRCFVSAEYNNGNIFNKWKLKFQSREGTYWNSLDNLESYLLSILPEEFLNRMVDEHMILDGELYIPGKSVNEINHYVKDAKCVENKLLQYWIYDIAIEDIPQYKRNEILYDAFSDYDIEFNNIININTHLSVKDRVRILPNYIIKNDDDAISLRDKFIDIGFEGLILRKSDGLYQYGKRNQTMIKYKKSTDGKFIIVDVIPEGLKRPDIPLFVCKNDINDQCFECHVGGSLDYQRQCLKNKDKLIGKQMYVEYGERSGVYHLPFHIKQTYILNGDS